MSRGARSSRRLLASIALVGSLWATEGVARAGPTDESAAEAAFATGRALMRQGRYREACEKLEASQSLDPGIGTLLNLGECYERSGKSASAWLRYREAAGMALRANQREREAIAREKVTELEPTLCHLILHAPKDGMTVTRDGAVVDPSAFGLRVPIDAGLHAVQGAVDGATVVREDVVVRPASGGVCADTVVTLKGRPAAAPSAAPSRDSGRLSAGRVGALAAFGGGLVGVGLGTAFGLSASSLKDEADAECRPEGCTPIGRSRMADAGDRADVSTVAFVAASALVVTGVVLWIVSPPKTKSVGAAAFQLRF